MGKANKVKIELRDSVEMVDLIQTLKDIADNKLYTLSAQKEKFRRFGETFVEFFRMISLTKASHLLINNDNPHVGIVVVTIEGSFLGEFNNKIIRKAIEEGEKHDQKTYMAVGDKSVERLEKYTPNMKVFTNMEGDGIYKMAVEVKNHLVDKVMNGEFGRVIVVHSWLKTFESPKTRVLKLLPCDELLSKQTQYAEEFDNIIEESNPEDAIGFLANLWVTTRLYEIFIDTIIASASAQAQFLDDSLEKMKKEEKKIRLKYRKAKKGDIDKSLRETFSARMMSMK